MTKEEIIEGNRIIHEFDGRGGLSVIYPYHQKWNYLMPVVEKIEQTIFEYCKTSIVDGRSLYYPRIDLGKFMWSNHNPYWSVITLSKHDEEIPELHINIYGSTKIESVWLAVVEFIKWYIQQSK